jgi:CDP-diglyceride synthetase
MAEEKEYSEIIKEQTEKAIEAARIGPKKDLEDALFGAAGVIFGGPILVVVFMAVSLVACSTMGEMMQ